MQLSLTHTQILNSDNTRWSGTLRAPEEPQQTQKSGVKNLQFHLDEENLKRVCDRSQR